MLGKLIFLRKKKYLFIGICALILVFNVWHFPVAPLSVLRKLVHPMTLPCMVESQQSKTADWGHLKPYWVIVVSTHKMLYIKYGDNGPYEKK
jgi:hypothetical protein